MAVVRSSRREYNSPERRCERVMLKAPVVILTRGADNKAMFEETQTITVNILGAMIASRLKFEAGQIITLRNSRTGEEAPCRVVYLSPPFKPRTERLASSSWSRVLSSGASLFLLLTGRPKTPKRKATEIDTTAPQFQRRNKVKRRWLSSVARRQGMRSSRKPK
jgi:hypothetical protein